jgi:hypothetical protein
LNTAREKARKASCVSNLKALSTSITMYSDDNNGYMPVELSDDNFDNVGTYLPVGSTASACPKGNIAYDYETNAGSWQAVGSSVNAEDNSTGTHIGKTNQLWNDGRVTGDSSGSSI